MAGGGGIIESVSGIFQPSSGVATEDEYELESYWKRCSFRWIRRAMGIWFSGIPSDSPDSNEMHRLDRPERKCEGKRESIEWLRRE